MLVIAITNGRSPQPRSSLSERRGATGVFSCGVFSCGVLCYGVSRCGRGLRRCMQEPMEAAPHAMLLPVHNKLLNFSDTRIVHGKLRDIPSGARLLLWRLLVWRESVRARTEAVHAGADGGGAQVTR